MVRITQDEKQAIVCPFFISLEPHKEMSSGGVVNPFHNFVERPEDKYHELQKTGVCL